MSNITTNATVDPSVELNKAIADFNTLVEKPDDATKGNKNLWYAWHFLQVYSTWGLRLPHTEATLKMLLGVSDPGKYLFFNPMVEGYDEIHQASENFIVNIFPKVVKVGTNLLNFASDASHEDGDIFAVLIEILEEDGAEGALELIQDLQDAAKKNTDEAEALGKLLNEYRAQLESANEKVAITQKKVQADSKTSQETIDKLSGDSDAAGSLANMRKMLEQANDDYDHYVVVASTTVTYAWLIPLGLFAGVTVAGIFGDKAVKTLKRVHTLEAEVAKTNETLHTALQVNKVQGSADQSLSQAKAYTDLAIIHTNTVQNAWASITSNLAYVADKVKSMTKADEPDKLKNIRLVKNYAKNAGEKWTLLVPPLKELTRDPYIVVESDGKNLEEFATEVEKEIVKQAA